jgi:hypothetical protein
MSQPIINERKKPDDWAALPLRVREWFSEFDGSGGGKAELSGEACHFLARKLQLAFNHADNLAITRAHENKHNTPVPIDLLRDIDAQKYESDKLERFLDAARNLLYEADRLEEYFGNYTWGHGVDLAAIRYQLHQIGIASKQLPAPEKPSPGRSIGFWHETGRAIARAIRDVAKQAGYQRVGITDPTSITAHVGACAITWAYGGPGVSASGFVDGVRKSGPKGNRAKRALVSHKASLVRKST